MRLYDPEKQARVDRAKARTWGRWAKIPRGRVLHWFSAYEKGVALCGATPQVGYAKLRHCPKCETELRSAQYVAGIRMPANRSTAVNAPWNKEDNK